MVNKDGRKETKPEYFYGYKDQISLNAETEIVTSIKPGYANDYDGRHLPDLVEKDLKKGIEVKVVAGDKGYDDGENHYFLNQKGINSAIRLNNYRTLKKDKNKQGWAEIKDSQEYNEGLKERYKIEQKFVKKWHGFSRCRYIGFLRHAIQCYLIWQLT
ncbi:transposase [Dehalococcoidales bacterium]|nr:transposase [Dehalococcoidales bacterium]